MADVAGRLAYLDAKLAYEIDTVAAFQAQSSGRAVIVDTRKVHSWDHGHVAGALHLPAEEIERGLEKLHCDRTVIVYGWGPGCNGATYTARLLLDRGFDVREMVGGFEYWARNGFPVEGRHGDATQPADPLVTAESQ